MVPLDRPLSRLSASTRLLYFTLIVLENVIGGIFDPFLIFFSDYLKTIQSSLMLRFQSRTFYEGFLCVRVNALIYVLKMASNGFW